MNKRKKLNTKRKKNECGEVVTCFLPSYEEVVICFDCALQNWNITMAETTVAQKAYRFLCEYTDSYGPDHGVFVDEDGRVIIDHDSSGWQAATRDLSRGLVKLSVFHEE
jgi:hypothetical protein